VLYIDAILFNLLLVCPARAIILMARRCHKRDRAFQSRFTVSNSDCLERRLRNSSFTASAPE
jgi:hypothetical protein